MKRLLVLTVLCGTAGSFTAVGASLPGDPAHTLTFTLDRAAPPPTHFEVQVDTATGKGTYHQSGPEASGEPGALAQDAPIAVDPPTLKKLLGAVPAIQRHHCESHSTAIAQTGKKTLRFSEDGPAVECTYNYSDDERVNTATNLFIALGETMQYGQRLAAKLRFDRLGLDEQMDLLRSAVQDGRAIGVRNIAPVLQSIAEDDRVMDRVRRKAAALLEGAGIASAQSADSATPKDR